MREVLTPIFRLVARLFFRSVPQGAVVIKKISQNRVMPQLWVGKAIGNFKVRRAGTEPLGSLRSQREHGTVVPVLRVLGVLRGEFLT